MPLNRHKDEFKVIPQDVALPFMVGSKDPERVLILAGHGIFMNMLLAQVDNDNITFAFNCVRWLSQAPGGGKRKYALFVENGTIAREFDSGLIGTPRLPVPPTQVLNRMIRGLEEENFFNRLLQQFFTRNEIMRTALMMCSLVLLLYGGWRLIGARQRSEAAVPLTTPGLAVIQEQPILSQRRSALTAKGNFAEPAAGLVRSFFAEYAPLTARESLRTNPVAFQANGGWLRRLLLLRLVNYLRRIETGQAGTVSARQLQGLPAVFDRVAAAIQEGRLLVNSEG